MTVGLAERICQLCGKENPKGLSSHHVLGKENDPHNVDLIALCPGCHHIVGVLGGREFIDDSKTWERLIAFAWLRRHGGNRDNRKKSLYTEVIIELEDDDQEEVN